MQGGLKKEAEIILSLKKVPRFVAMLLKSLPQNLNLNLT